MTAKTRANFKTDKNTDFADSPAGNITALELRNQMDHLADSALFPEDSAFTTTQGLAASALQPANIDVSVAAYVKNTIASVPPAPTDDSGDGYSLESMWFDNVTGRLYRPLSTVGVGVADWVDVAQAAVDELDAELGDLAYLNNVDFVTPATEQVQTYDAGGNASIARKTVGSDVALIWYNSPTQPVNMGVRDIWFGAQDGTLPSTAFAASGSLALGDVAAHNTNASGTVTITIPANATVPKPIGATVRFTRYAAGELVIRGASGVTVHGVANGAFSIDNQLGVLTAHQILTNVWVLSGDAKTQEASTATLSVPTAGFTVTDDGTYYVIESTGTGSLGNIVVTDAEITAARDLLIGGGGSGGTGSSSHAGGGGGAGAFLARASFNLAVGTYAVVIGAGGAAQASANSHGNAGVASTFGARTAGGGGRGGWGSTTNEPGGSGVDGSSGGGGGSINTAVNLAGGAASSPGTAGGDGLGSTTSGNRAGGGGGGSGGAGGAASTAVGGNGGLGTASDISGSSVTYAAGGEGSQITGTVSPPTGSTNAGSGGGGRKSALPGFAGVAGKYFLKVEKAQVATLTRT